MKRFTAILVLITLACYYTGVQLCVDFCCDSVESIHFGEEEGEALCHIDDCGAIPDSDCCDSEQFQVEPQLLDFTVNQFEDLKTPFVYIQNQLNPIITTLYDGEKPTVQPYNIPYHSVQVRDLTQVILC